MSIALVIFLHGVGSRGADLEPLAQFLSPTLPGAAFEAPDAPHPFDMGGAGRQWFSVMGVTEANRAARIEAARPGFDDIIRRLSERHGLADQPEKVALVGFSQGTIMALDAVATRRWPVGAVVGFSGRLATPDPLHPANASKLLLVHGTADMTIPATESEKACQRLAAAGSDVALKLLNGLGHSISREGMELVSTFLSSVR